MPRLTKSVPRYRKHRHSGQAIVTLDGRDFYLGPHGSKTSINEYDRLIAEWLAGGRRLPQDSDGCEESLSVSEVAALYWKHAQKYYRKNGQPTSEVDEIRLALRPVKRLYGRRPAADFGPKALKAVRQTMIEDGLSRGTINQRIGKVKRMFKWAAAEELAPAAVSGALQTVSGLGKGRTKAAEPAAVEPVPEEVYQATLPHMSQTITDMVRFQRLTGARPGEVCILRPMDVDRAGEVWVYRPESHKTEHRDKSRIIFIGPRAQEILRAYLVRPAWEYCFSPVESEADRHATMRAARKSKVQPSQFNRKKARPKRKPGNRYTTTSYRRAIHRAVELANREREKAAKEAGEKFTAIPPWGPNRLRHVAATEIRRLYGIEKARTILGHSHLNTTEIYAEADMKAAREIIGRIG